LVPLAQLLAKITGQLRTNMESRQQIRSRLDPQIAHLIERINLLIQRGTGTLRKQGKQGLVEHGEQLRSLRCHLVYTVPIASLYSKNVSVLTGIFPDCRVLPMIKTHTPQNQPCPEGLATLRLILAERIELETVCLTAHHLPGILEIWES
jgi:hypothetical protein